MCEWKACGFSRSFNFFPSFAWTKLNVALSKCTMMMMIMLLMNMTQRETISSHLYTLLSVFVAEVFVCLTHILFSNASHCWSLIVYMYLQKCIIPNFNYGFNQANERPKIYWWKLCMQIKYRSARHILSLSLSISFLSFYFLFGNLYKFFIRTLLFLICRRWWIKWTNQSFN